MTLAFANETRGMRFEPRGLRSVTKAGKGSSSPPKAKNSPHGVRAAEELVAAGGRVSREAGVPSHGVLQISPRCWPWRMLAKVGRNPDGLACTPTPTALLLPSTPSLGVHPVGVQGCGDAVCRPRGELCREEGAAIVRGGSGGPLSPRGCLAPGAGVPRSRGGQWDLQQPRAARSPLEVVVAMGSIVASFPPALYILRLAFSQGEQ